MSTSTPPPVKPVSLSKQGDDRLVIVWSDGHRGEYFWKHLREQCPLLRATRVGTFFVRRVVERAVQHVEVGELARVGEAKPAPALEQLEGHAVPTVRDREVTGLQR